MTTEIISYNQNQTDTFRAICELLMSEINAALPEATSKLYHANPVWFQNDNPIVGYDVASDHVNLLFWSGQSFEQPGLKVVGKFKAAQAQYTEVGAVDVAQLKAWLQEAQTTQWNYRDLRENNGELVKL